jgi:phosphohistidine phosphatase
MRHGKSDWGAGASDDHGRPLAPRGVKAAKRIGRYLKAVECVPELVLTSSAVRARTTAELAIQAGRWSCPLQVCAGLYAASSATVLRHLGELAGEEHRVMVVGHEPTSSELISLLVGGAGVRFPTAAVACLELTGEGWSTLGRGCGELQWLVTPRVVRSAGA